MEMSDENSSVESLNPSLVVPPREPVIIAGAGAAGLAAAIQLAGLTYQP